MITEQWTTPRDRLLDQCYWLIRLRWLAGTAVILGAICEATWLDWMEHAIPTALLGAGIVMYNALLFAMMRRPMWHRMPDTALVWSQILPDLACLTILALWTGAAHSPLLGFFVFHMVFASLLLSRLTAYAAAATAMAMFVTSLILTGQMPQDSADRLILLGWCMTLLLTVYLANHITDDLRQRQTELRRQHRRMRSILDTAADGIITIDQAGVIESFNPTAERMFGYTVNQAVGQPLTIIIPQCFQEGHEQGLQRWVQTGSSDWIGKTVERTGKRKDGTEFPVGLTLGMWQAGQGWFATGILRDITARKQAEAALRQLHEKLKNQQQAMIQHEKMVAVGQMVAGISHEIANPLASMDSVLQLIERYPQRMNPQRLVALRQQVDRIRCTIGHMTDFSHPTELEWQTVPVDELVATALTVVRFDRRHRNVFIEQRLLRPSCQVRVQPHAVQQVLVNILLNAFDAVADQPHPHVIVSSHCSEDCCCIAIEDNGPGIAPDQMEHLFEPFYTTKPVGKGTGLGLAISQSLINNQGGNIEVSGKLGKGAIFTISLVKAANSWDR